MMSSSSKSVGAVGDGITMVGFINGDMSCIRLL